MFEVTVDGVTRSHYTKTAALQCLSHALSDAETHVVRMRDIKPVARPGVCAFMAHGKQLCAKKVIEDRRYCSRHTNVMMKRDLIRQLDELGAGIGVHERLTGMHLFTKMSLSELRYHLGRLQSKRNKQNRKRKAREQPEHDEEHRGKHEEESPGEHEGKHEKESPDGREEEPMQLHDAGRDEEPMEVHDARRDERDDEAREEDRKRQRREAEELVDRMLI